MQRKIHHEGGLAAALLALAAASGCATAKPERVVWPFPPDKPRVEYVRSITQSSDVESGLRRFWSVLAGKRGVAIKNPTALAMSPDEKRLYVSCSPLRYVAYFDLANGATGYAASVEGHSPAKPFGLAVDGEGNLYVGDEGGDKLVWVYSAEGKFLRQIGKGLLERPVGVAFDRQRRLLYVVDGSNGASQNHRVQVFAPDGRHLRTIGTRGSNPGEFNFPSYVTVGPDGKVYVADTLNFRIQVFDPEGTFLTMFGTGGDGPGQFGKIKGMAFDSFGNFYVADGQTAVVQMFNQKFRPLMFFGGPARVPPFMDVPNAVVIDSKNRIFVSDFGLNHVNQYALVNTAAADSEAPSTPAPGAEAAQKAPAGTAAPAPDAARR